MKSRILCSLVLAGFALSAVANIVEDGRSWLMGRVTSVFSEEQNGEQCSYFTAKVTGDTIVNGLACKKIKQHFPEGGTEDVTYVVHEDNGTIRLLLDHPDTFGIDLYVKEGEFFDIMSFNFYDEQYVDRYCAYNNSKDSPLKATLVNTHVINGYKHNEYSIEISDMPGTVLSCWVEGIGASWSDPYTSWITFFPYTTPSRPTFTGAYMLECSQNGEVIFTAQDFSMPVEYANIRDIHSAQDKSASSLIFDLQGRQIAQPQRGQIYIRQGKKFVF